MAPSHLSKNSKPPSGRYLSFAERRRLVADRRFNRLAADDALQTHAPHQPFDRAARHVLAVAQQLPPDLAGAVNAKVFVENSTDFFTEFSVAPGPRRKSRRILMLRRMLPIGRRGDRQHFADRLDPVRFRC